MILGEEDSERTKRGLLRNDKNGEIRAVCHDTRQAAWRKEEPSERAPWIQFKKRLGHGAYKAGTTKILQTKRHRSFQAEKIDPKLYHRSNRIKKRE